MILTVTDDRVSQFVASALGKTLVPPYTMAGLEKDGEIIAGVIFNNYEGPDIQVSIAGHGWTRGFLADVGHYVFNQLKCERITAITEKVEVVRIAERLGGRVEGLMRNHFGPDRDGFIVGILKEEYRF